MSNELFKNQFYAGLLEIVTDRKYFYNSEIMKDNSRFTEEGEKALVEYVAMMAPYMIEKEKKKLEEMAKSMTWDTLKQ